jgi:hypothetical protein
MPATNLRSAYILLDQNNIEKTVRCLGVYTDHPGTPSDKTELEQLPASRFPATAHDQWRFSASEIRSLSGGYVRGSDRGTCQLNQRPLM